MSFFPKEVWLRIFLHLDLPSLVCLSQCSKFLFGIGNSNVLWKQLFQRDFVRDLELLEDEDTGFLEPTWDVEGGVWLRAADAKLVCAKCRSSVGEDGVVFSNNCVMHRQCLEGLDPQVLFWLSSSDLLFGCVMKRARSFCVSHFFFFPVFLFFSLPS